MKEWKSHMIFMIMYVRVFAYFLPPRGNTVQSILP